MCIRDRPYSISKKAVIAAYQKVKANKGTYGVDEQSIEDFERKLNNNLYKIWNRMSSGTYFPQPVKAVAIPKKNGGTRILGIPTVEDRIAQMVAKLYFEPNVEPIFYAVSYTHLKPKIIGHYEKVEPPSESLLKRLRENGMSYTAQQRLFSA